MRVGAILKACRTRAGLSQEELAHKLYISQSDVSKYENDAMEPRLSVVQAWASNTQSQEIFVALICGVDGLSIMQNLMDTATTVISTIGGII